MNFKYSIKKYSLLNAIEKQTFSNSFELSSKINTVNRLF